MRNGWETAPSPLENSLGDLVESRMRKVVREEITNSRPMVEPRLLDTKTGGALHRPARGDCPQAGEGEAHPGVFG